MTGKPPQFGDYQLELRLSLGTMCETFLARAPSGQKVALKRLLPSAEEDSDARAMFLEEMKLARQLAHPCLTQFVDAGHVGNRPYLVSAFVPGVSVRELFKTASAHPRLVSIPAIAAIGIQAAKGLAYLHTFCDSEGAPLRVVHRDVSPKNILIGTRGHVHLADLGIAHFTGRAVHTSAGLLKGTASYMSPEQVRGEPLDPRSDLFSLSVVLYELLSGERLFHGDSLIETYDRVERVELPTSLPCERTAGTRLEQILRESLQRSADARHVSATAFVEALHPLLQEEDPLGILVQELKNMWPEGIPTANGHDLAAYRASLSSAEERGEETTDQSDRSNITRWTVSPKK